MVRAIQNDPTLQPSTKHQYIKALENYLATGGSLANPQSLTEYALTVVSARPDNIAVIQAAVFRTQALQNAIKIQQPQGEKALTWLSYHEAEQLLKDCSRRPSGKREFEIYTLRDRLSIGLDDGCWPAKRRSRQHPVYRHHQTGQALCAECDRERCQEPGCAYQRADGRCHH